jgi:hypothetical protein
VAGRLLNALRGDASALQDHDLPSEAEVRPILAALLNRLEAAGEESADQALEELFGDHAEPPPPAEPTIEDLQAALAAEQRKTKRLAAQLEDATSDDDEDAGQGAGAAKSSSSRSPAKPTTTTTRGKS